MKLLCQRWVFVIFVDITKLPFMDFKPIYTPIGAYFPSQSLNTIYYQTLIFVNLLARKWYSPSYNFWFYFFINPSEKWW